MELNHMDAKANLTTAERFRRAGARARLRHESLGEAVPLTLGHWEFIAHFAIGSPPQEVHAVLDTMSSLVWTQCMPCGNDCFYQDVDIYDFSLSSTGMAVSCNDSLCSAGHETQPCTGDDGRAGACAVRTTSVGVDLAGVLRIEEFTFGSAKASIAFGCITKTDTTGIGEGEDASGVIGLGKGPLSLVSQIGGNRFSYCLSNRAQSSLLVGPSAVLNGGAPFASAPFSPRSSYNLLLAAVSVGEADLNIPSEDGGVIIDVRTPFMFLVDAAYKELMQELSRRLGGSLVLSPIHDMFELCVAPADVSRLVPPLVLRFGQGGGAWAIPAENYWIQLNIEASCMMVSNSALSNGAPMNRTTVIGNYMLQNMHVLYDLDNEEVSFQPADCSSI
jgi:hypothetical protein